MESLTGALEVDEHAKPRVLTVGELQQLERRVEDVAECADDAHNRLELGSSVEDNDARCSSRAQPPQRPHWRSTMPHGLSRCGEVILEDRPHSSEDIKI